MSLLLALVFAAGAAGAPAAAGVAPAALPDAQPKGVKVRVEKTTVRLGEPFDYEIEVRHTPEERYLLSGAPPLDPFRAAGDARCARTDAPGEARTTCTLRLALFALGPADVPDLTLEVERPAGKARLVVPGPRITAAGILDPAAPAGALALRDIAPPVPLLVRSLRPLWWTLGVLGAVALLAGVAVFVARRRGARRAEAAALGPIERFEQRLAALATEDLPRRGRGAEHVERLAEAIREYLAACTGLPALDLTTGELVGSLARAADPRIDVGALEAFLCHADLVKFARQPAAPEACAAGLAFAWELLRRTRPSSEAASG